MKVRLNGETWRIIRRGRSRGVKKVHGYTLTDKRAIYLSPQLKGRKLIEIAVHELIHARFIDLDEDSVTEAAEAIALVLHRLGVRHGQPANNG